MNWKKIFLYKEGTPIKVYVNKTNTRAIVFPLYGRYFSFSSDVSALDLAVEILFHKFSDGELIYIPYSYQSYLNSQEDTAIIVQEAA